MARLPDRPDEPARRSSRAGWVTPVVLGLASLGSIGLWWALAPHVLSALSLGMAARSGGQHPEELRRRLRTATISLAGAVIVLCIANDLAALRGRAFLPRWE